MSSPLLGMRSPAWEWLWAGLIVLIEMQLLMYSESLILLRYTLRHN